MLHWLARFNTLAVTPEGVVWLIIVFIWGVAQMINQAKRGRTRSLPSDEPPRRTQMDEQLRELLETMTGTQLDRPPQAPPPPPRPVARTMRVPGEERVHPAYRRYIEVPTGTEASRRRRPPPPPIEESPRTSESTEPAIPRRSRPAVEQGMVIPNIVVPVRAMDMPDAMRLSLSTPSFGREGGAEPPDLETLDDVRRGLFYAIILGPCKAFEPPHQSLI